MRAAKKTFFKGSPCLPLIALALSGCATVEPGPVIKAGDKVGIHFTCSLPNGQVAATTHKEVIYDRTLAKAAILIPVYDEEPVAVTAGEPARMSPLTTPGFEEEIIRQLTLGVVGMREGEQRSLTLTAETVPVRGNDPQKLEMSRVRHRPKVAQMLREKYKNETGKEPAVGLPYIMDPAMPGKITAMTDKEITVAFSAKPGSTIRTPFGVGTIREKDDRFDIDIDVKPGSLVRSGPLVGRVSEVGAETFTIDYSNPFAGESLNCALSAVGMHKNAEQNKADKSIAAKSETGASPAVAAKTGAPANQELNQAEMDRVKAAVTEAIKSGKSSVDLSPAALPGQAAKGDLVTVRFTINNPDGSPLLLPEGSAKQGTPQELMAGREELFPGVGEAVIGMTAGEKKQFTLPPQKAFGPHDASKTAKYPLINKVPATITLPADEYVKRFGGFPAVGKEVPVIPYVKAKVTRIGEKDVTLSVSATDGARFSEPYGTVTAAVDAEGVTLTLAPKLGATVPAGDRQGVITASDSETFTVDSNPPLAGKTILLDLEVLSLTKATNLQSKTIDWIEEHDSGLAQAKKEGKPVFLLLYADWCGWCKKTMTETIPDPRISGLKDKFVWVKANSDKEKKYKEMYGQNSFPLILVLNPDGTLRKRIDGYRDARALKGELEGVL